MAKRNGLTVNRETVRELTMENLAGAPGGAATVNTVCITALVDKYYSRNGLWTCQTNCTN